MDEVNACDELARRILDALPDAQLVACGPDKRAIQAGWPALFPTAADLTGAALVGVIPASVGLVAVDVDTDGMPTYTAAEMARRRQGVEQAIGEPLATCKTPSGGGHMFYRSPDEEVRNRKWLNGDVRGSRGYVIAWDVDALLHAAGAANMATAPDLGALPTRDTFTVDGKITGPAAVRAATEGERNEVLYRQTFHGAASAIREGKEFDPSEYHAAGISSGLETEEVERTIQSAIDGAQSAEAENAKNPTGTAPGTGTGTGSRTGSHPVPDPETGTGSETRIYVRPNELEGAGEYPAVVLPGLAWKGMLSMLVADAKTGKTTLVAQAIACMLQGAPFLQQRCAPGRVAVVEEMALPFYWTWLQRYGCTDDVDLDLIGACRLADLLSYIDERQPALLVIDTLIALAANNQKGENSSNEMRELSGALQRRGVACLILHHTKKNDATLYRGSGDILAAQDMSITMRAMGDRRELSYLGRWTQEKALLDWRPDTREYQVGDQTDRGRVIEQVYREPGQTKYHHAQSLTMRRERVYTAINELVALDMIQERDGKLYPGGVQ